MQRVRSVTAGSMTARVGRNQPSSPAGASTGDAPVIFTCSGNVGQNGVGMTTSSPSSQVASSSPVSACFPPEVIEDVRGPEVEVEVPPVAVGHRRPQVGSARVRGVAGVARLDGLDPRLPRHRRGVEVRLSGGEVHDVLPGGLETHRLRHHGHGGRG